ncbi:hypothetical protein FACS1894202_14530 [Clostridia bacterium]|nr:hypothetical protein FACS1894202_14530 [Clostridia bacterium]
MARKQTIQVFRGLKANLPTLLQGEIGFCTDTGEVFIGNGTTNLPVGGTADLPKIGIGYGTCSTASGTAAKVGVVADFVLKVGSHVAIRFTNADTSTNATLNINGTGAKAIYYSGARITAGMIPADFVAEFVYGENYWRLINTPATPVSHGYQIFTASGTFSPISNGIILGAPATVVCIGGGGGGGGSAGGSGGGNNGTPGGSTSFGAVVVAQGGPGGVAPSPGGAGSIVVSDITLSNANYAITIGAPGTGGTAGSGGGANGGNAGKGGTGSYSGGTAPGAGGGGGGYGGGGGGSSTYYNQAAPGTGGAAGYYISDANLGKTPTKLGGKGGTGGISGYPDGTNGANGDFGTGGTGGTAPNNAPANGTNGGGGGGGRYISTSQYTAGLNGADGSLPAGMPGTLGQGICVVIW